jgi:hypothetical protein
MTAAKAAQRLILPDLLTITPSSPQRWDCAADHIRRAMVQQALLGGVS